MPTQLSLSQAAKQLKVSEKSIRRYIKSGRIKAVLIKGEKGYEYRINKEQLKNFVSPPRGKNSHRGVKKVKKLKNKKIKGKENNPALLKLRRTIKLKKQDNKTTRYQNIKTTKKKNINSRKPRHFNNGETNIPIAPKVDSISEILEQKIKNAADYLGAEKNSVNYKLLYERLLAKYEQALIMIGSLEAQITNHAPQNSDKVTRLEQDLAKQEEMILGMYQDLKLYKENDSRDF